MYSLYNLVLFSSSDFCAAYNDYFDALTQILHAPCNTDEIGGSRHFLLPVVHQEAMVALPIHCLLPPIHPPWPRPVRFSPSNLSGRSGPSLQANFSHTVKISKGLISLSDLMIPLPHLKIEIDTMNITLIQHSLPYLHLLSTCAALVLPILFS